MRTRRAGQVWCLLLALLFSANTTLLPFADALLDHSRPGPLQPASHVDRPGGCGSHAEHCVLTFGGAVVADHAAPRPRLFSALFGATTPGGSGFVPPWRASHRHPPSRAPPASSA